VRVEVETEDLAQVREAINAGADIVMLDDFELEQLRAAVVLNRAQPRPVLLECSGGVTLANVREIAETGVDYISVGAITKHIAAIDLSMRVLAAQS
jgi:nicotinate-nucleotide pyrophosphorylase (carboxylating)